MTQVNPAVVPESNDPLTDFSIVTEALVRLSLGDSAICFTSIAENDHLASLKILINQLAAHIRETNNQAQEMAIGLCEHYETLNRIARGDFSVRAAIDSDNEVVAKLGELINLEADTLTGAIDRARLAEGAAKDAYQKLFDIVEFLPDATFVVDQERRVIAWNRAIEELTGVMKQDILGKGDYAYAIPFYNDNRPLLIDLLDQEDERIRNNYKQIRQEGQTLFTEVLVPSFRNGESRYFWATATPLCDKDGNRVGGIESIRDITAYKRAEEDRSRLESELGHARMMESFMIRLGHDLRTPLTPLFVLLPLIKSRLTDPELQKIVDSCTECATTMKNLLDKAQKLVKFSATNKASDFESIPLVAILERALANCAASLAPKQIVCRHDVDPSIVVQAAPGQLEEVICNLITNAANVSPPEGVIRITATQSAKVVTVAVHDDGLGLQTEHLERIFDELFKVDESRHDLDSAGLGLSICRRIIANHRGRIWAESPGIGKGTTITFTINEQGADR